MAVMLTDKRALCLTIAELELMARALADFEIDTWGGASSCPEYQTLHDKIATALRAVDVANRQAGLHGR